MPLTMGVEASFIKTLFTMVCPLDSMGYQPLCITVPESKTITSSTSSIPKAVKQALTESQSNLIWFWVASTFAVFLVLFLLALLLNAKSKSKLVANKLVQAKAECRKLRMKITELINPPQPIIEEPEILSKSNFIHTYTTKIFRTSKSGEPIETCADMVHVNLKDQVFAIADGVSQSFNSAKWAELLVTEASKPNGVMGLLNHVPTISSDWENDCKLLLKGEEPQSFLLQKQQQGSQSTLAALKLISRTDGQNWQFNTIGDSLLIVLDASESSPLIRKFYPWSRADDFPAGPDIVSTRRPFLRGHIKTFEFESVVREKLLLMTDAMARYAVTNGAIGSEIAKVFPFLESNDLDFESWITNARQNGLGDDDSTLILISPHYE